MTPILVLWLFLFAASPAIGWGSLSSSRWAEDTGLETMLVGLRTV